MDEWIDDVVLRIGKFHLLKIKIGGYNTKATVEIFASIKFCSDKILNMQCVRLYFLIQAVIKHSIAPFVIYFQCTRNLQTILDKRSSIMQCPLPNSFSVDILHFLQFDKRDNKSLAANSLEHVFSLPIKIWNEVLYEIISLNLQLSW